MKNSLFYKFYIIWLKLSKLTKTKISPHAYKRVPLRTVLIAKDYMHVYSHTYGNTHFPLKQNPSLCNLTFWETLHSILQPEFGEFFLDYTVFFLEGRYVEQEKHNFHNMLSQVHGHCMTYQQALMWNICLRWNLLWLSNVRFCLSMLCSL